MKKSLISWIVLTLIYANVAVSQVITISPLNPSPSNLSILSPSSAGAKPNDPLFNYIGQKISYTSPFGWGNSFVVDVNSNSIPTGLSFIIQASSNYSGNPKRGDPGISTGPVTVTTTYQPIVTGIAKIYDPLTRQLTQSMIISDFSQLHPGQYSVTINFWLH